jgi:lipid-A-disaccharide synthase
VRILVSAGEASGDMYAAQLVNSLRGRGVKTTFFGCTGPRLREAGVETVIDSSKLSVVGLAEVVGHLPGIYREYRRLVRAIRKAPPDAAILTDSPDFHLRLARHLRALGVPVYYLVAPQVWAWRQGRVGLIRERVKTLFCLFPFEEPWFRERGVDARYIGHPLATSVNARWSRQDFFARHGLDPNVQTVALLPGSRAGEALRHLPDLLGTCEMLRRKFALQFVVGTPHGFAQRGVYQTFRERMDALSIQVIEDETWDVLAHADVALAASGTVTVEAAVLGTPMVTFYKVTGLSWWAGRRLVKVPYLSMVNLIAGRMVVPEYIQHDMTPENLASATAALLDSAEKRQEMRRQLSLIKQFLTGSADSLVAGSLSGGPLEKAAGVIAADLQHARI